MSFDPPTPDPEQSARLVKAAGPYPDLKPGFTFTQPDYGDLTVLKTTSDIRVYTAPRGVRRYVEWERKGSGIEIAISVHAGSIQAARAEFVPYILRSTMLPPQ